jgi:hypothetical protein
MSKKVSKKSLSVPKKKKVIKKSFKGVHQVCPNKKKVAKKSLKGIPQVCPNKKKVSKEVPKKSPKCAQTIKKVQILFQPLFSSGLVTSFKISPLLLGTISEKGDETRKRNETEYETQEGIIDNFITWSLIF